MTALYLKAAAVLAISLVAFILVTRAAWPANVYLYRRFRLWRQGLPERWKRFRNPEYRRRQEAVDRYLEIFGSLVAMRARRDAIARERPGAGETYGRWLDALAEDNDARFAGMQLIAVEYLRQLDGATVGDIADRLNADLFNGRAPSGELRAFIEEERGAIAASPQFAADHAQRLARRFGSYAQAA